MAKITPNAQGKDTAATTADQNPGGAAQAQGATVKAPSPNKGVKKPSFEGVNSNDPKVYPFPGHTIKTPTIVGDKIELVDVSTATPEGFDFSKHKLLKRKDFAKGSLFLRHQAERLAWLAKQQFERADLLVKEGDGSGAGKATRLVKMMDKVDELRKALAAQGIDVDALLKKSKPAEAPKAPAPAAEAAKGAASATVTAKTKH